MIDGVISEIFLVAESGSPILRSHHAALEVNEILA